MDGYTGRLAPVVQAAERLFASIKVHEEMPHANSDADIEQAEDDLLRACVSVAEDGGMTPESYRQTIAFFARSEPSSPERFVFITAARVAAMSARLARHAEVLKKEIFHGKEYEAVGVSLRDVLKSMEDVGRFDLEVHRSRPLSALTLKQERTLNYILGIIGESGEITERLLGILFSDLPAELIDTEGLVKEFGDLLWYIVRCMDLFSISMGDVMSANVEKLKGRYPDGWAAATKHFGFEDSGFTP